MVIYMAHGGEGETAAKQTRSVNDISALSTPLSFMILCAAYLRVGEVPDARIRRRRVEQCHHPQHHHCRHRRPHLGLRWSSTAAVSPTPHFITGNSG